MPTETTLPVVAGILSHERPREVLTLAGLIFHEPVEEDSTICRVTLPCGWSKTPIVGVRFQLLDDRGRERAESFECSKPGRPFISLSRRFYVVPDTELRATHRQIRSLVKGADGVTSFATQTFQIEDWMNYDHEYNLGLRVKEEAESWLDEYFEHWRSPSAYWD